MLVEWFVSMSNSVVFLQKAQSADYQKETTEGHGFNCCDTYAVAAAINDSLITQSEQVMIPWFYGCKIPNDSAEIIYQ